LTPTYFRKLGQTYEVRGISLGTTRVIRAKSCAFGVGKIARGQSKRQNDGEQATPGSIPSAD